MKIIRKYLITNCKFMKIKVLNNPYKDELTVFINVKVEILKEFSKKFQKKLDNDERNNKDIIKIKTDKKYLLTISLSKLMSENNCLFEEIFLVLHVKLNYLKKI